MKPKNSPGQDSEAQLKGMSDLNTTVYEAPPDGSTNHAMDNVAEANDPAGTGKPLSRLVSTSQRE
jgi:hypothetical protein